MFLPVNFTMSPCFLSKISPHILIIFSISLVPEGAHTISPQSYAISGTQVNISWHLPSVPNGVIIRSHIYVYVNETSPPTLAKTVENSSSSGVVSGLTPYSVYEFTVVSCNSVGCTKHSAKTKTQTLASGRMVRVTVTMMVKELFLSSLSL